MFENGNLMEELEIVVADENKIENRSKSIEIALFDFADHQNFISENTNRHFCHRKSKYN